MIGSMHRNQETPDEPYSPETPHSYGHIYSPPSDPTSPLKDKATGFCFNTLTDHTGLLAHRKSKRSTDIPSGMTREQFRRERRKESNRRAAEKCRKKKQEQAKTKEQEIDQLKRINEHLMKENGVKANQIEEAKFSICNFQSAGRIPPDVYQHLMTVLDPSNYPPYTAVSDIPYATIATTEPCSQAQGYNQQSFYVQLGEEQKFKEEPDYTLNNFDLLGEFEQYFKAEFPTELELPSSQE